MQFRRTSRQSAVVPGEKLCYNQGRSLCIQRVEEDFFMPLFDTDVQELKNKVLRSVAELAFDGRLVPEDIPGIIAKYRD